MDTTLTKLATLEGSVAKLEQGLASVQDATEEPKGAVIGGEYSGVTVNGSGYILGLKKYTREDIKLKIDGVSYDAGNTYGAVWIALKYAFSNNTVYLLRAETSTHEKMVYFNISNESKLLSGNAFLNIKHGETRYSGYEYYGLNPIRFTKGFSYDNGFEIIYALDPT